MKLRLKIFRYDPAKGKSGYDTFEVECSEGTTFLSALQKIKEEDPTLSFRQFCRAGICGTCAILIDGFPRLACREQLFPYALLRGEVTGFLVLPAGNSSFLTRSSGERLPSNPLGASQR